MSGERSFDVSLFEGEAWRLAGRSQWPKPRLTSPLAGSRWVVGIDREYVFLGEAVVMLAVALGGDDPKRRHQSAVNISRAVIGKTLTLNLFDLFHPTDPPEHFDWRPRDLPPRSLFEQAGALDTAAGPRWVYVLQSEAFEQLLRTSQLDGDRLALEPQLPPPASEASPVREAAPPSPSPSAAGGRPREEVEKVMQWLNEHGEAGLKTPTKIIMRRLEVSESTVKRAKRAFRAT